MMTDVEFVLHVLSDGRRHTLNEILQRSFSERGCGLTVATRVSDARKVLRRSDPLAMIINEKIPGAKRGNASAYRLISSGEKVIPGATAAAADSPEVLPGQMDVFEVLADAARERKETDAKVH